MSRFIKNRFFWVFTGVFALGFLFCASQVLAEIIPNDPLFKNQGYLTQIGAPAAWGRGTGERDVVVAVIDSGVDLDHPDLKNNIWLNRKERENGKDDDGNGFVDDLHGWDFIDNDADPNPSFSPAYTDRGANHGTIIAGLIAAQGNNVEGIAGVTWRTMIMPLRVLDSSGSGQSRNIERAIDYAIKNGANIINLSFASKEPSEGLRLAIERAYKAGIVVVAAAGNDKDYNGNDLELTREYPVCYDGPPGENWVLGIAALDPLGQKAPFSDYGRICVDLSAPGMNLLSTIVFENRRYGFMEYYRGGWSGTSFASAMVAGAAALVKSFSPKLSNKEIYDFLRSGADSVSGLNSSYADQLGSGRLNVKKTLDLAARDITVGEEILPKSPFGAYLLAFSEGGDKPTVSIFEQSGDVWSAFYPFESFFGGLNVASGDVSGGETLEIVVGAAAPASSKVRIFSLGGKLLEEFSAFDAKRKYGANVALGDFFGFGTTQIATTEDAGGGAYARFWVPGEAAPRREIQIFASPWRSGARLWVADFDCDGVDELIAAPAAITNNPEVKIYRSDGALLRSFRPFPKGFRGILEIAPGDYNGLGWIDLAIASHAGGNGQVRFFNSEGRLLDAGFFAFGKSYRGGINLFASDINDDGKAELLATPRAQIKNRGIRVYNNSGELYNIISPKNISSFKHGIKINALIK